MKRLMILTLLFGLVFLSSCAQPKRPDYLWTGKTLELVTFQPVFAVWCKPSQSGWKLYKSTNDVEEIREILHYISWPEEEMLIEISKDQPHELLWLACLDPRYDKWTLKKMRFIMLKKRMKDDTFVGPRGKSKKVVSLLNGMDEVKPYFRRADQDKIREGLKQLHEQFKKQKKQEEARL